IRYVHRENPVGITKYSRAVRCKKDGSTPLQRLKCFSKMAFGAQIQMGAWFIEHQYRRFAYKRAGDAKAYPLSGGKLLAFLADDAIQAPLELRKCACEIHLF